MASYTIIGIGEESTDMDSNHMNNYDTDNGTTSYPQDNTYTTQYEQPYQQPTYSYEQPAPQQLLEEPMSLGDWMLTLLIMMVPCVNIVMMFVWAFGSGTKRSKANYFKASLIYFGIGLLLYIVLVLVIGVAAISMS